MLASLYDLAFYFTLLGIGGWYANRERSSESFFRLFTLGGLLTLLVSWWVLPAHMADALPVLIRDLLTLAGMGLVFGMGFGLGKRTPAWLAVVLLLAGLTYVFRDRLKLRLPVRPDSETVVLDPQGEWLVELEEGADAAVLRRWCVQHDIGCQVAFQPANPGGTLLDNYYVLDLPAAADVSVLLAQLQQLRIVAWQEPNEQITVVPIPAPPAQPDPNRRYGVDDPDISEQWAMEALGMDDLYRELAGRHPIRRATIAILDTGVDSQHEDLSDHYRSIRTTYDNDPKGHGTHCAGIAAAVTNNGKGIASMAVSPAFVQVTSVKVLGSSGIGTQKGIIDGIIEAADAGVDVISMSLGGFSNQSRQRAYNEAVAYANLHGAIVVAAAGNSNRSAANFCPANAKNVIGVSAIDQHLIRAPFSNRVDEIRMGIAAPGVGVYSTMPGDTYRAHSGTSMAAPFVSGLVGLLRSLQPNLTTSQVYDILYSTGRDISDGNLTGRLIQPAAAVRAIK